MGVVEAVARNASGTFVQLALYVGPLGVVGVVGDQGVASESACSVAHIKAASPRVGVGTGGVRGVF